MKKLIGMIGLLLIVLIQMVSAAKVMYVTSPNVDDKYKESDVLTVSVVFDEAVTVIPGQNGATLELETGVVNRNAVYINGSGTNTLDFSYTVMDGDKSCDLDYTTVNALVLNDNQIVDSMQNAVGVVLPDPGFKDSLKYNKHIVIGSPSCDKDLTGASVPEFNTLTFGLAIVAAGLGFVLLRKN